MEKGEDRGIEDITVKLEFSIKILRLAYKIGW
jgi:hypothetical protein